jgi:hypothetical protein
MIRQHAELAQCANGRNLVNFFVEHQPNGRYYPKFDLVCHGKYPDVRRK